LLLLLAKRCKLLLRKLLRCSLWHLLLELLKQRQRLSELLELLLKELELLLG
jgi:hypothetical protein